MPKDIPWGSPEAHAFTTNVGLVTSTGPNGPDIMAAEWSFLISYQPALMVISIGHGRATQENILATEEFGLSLAADDQSVLASVAGGSSGRSVDKIAALKELGFRFHAGKRIKAPMPEGTALALECRVIRTIDDGDHTLFIAQVEERALGSKPAVLYHQGKYWKAGEPVAKPAGAELERIRAIVEKHAK